MGAGQSTASGNKLREIDITEAARKGNQLVIDEQTSKDLGKIISVIGSFKTDDYQELSRSIEGINENLKENKIVINPKILEALKEHHRAILYHGFNDANKIERDKKADAILGNGVDYKKHLTNLADIDTDARIKSTSTYYNREFDESIEKIQKNPDIASNEAIQNSVMTVADTIKSMKARYKFFEYKYIQLNIFVIVLLQEVFSTMEAFHSNVLRYNKERDDLRIKATTQCFDIITNMLLSADISLTNDDDMKFTKALHNLEDSVKQQQGKLNEEISKLKETSTNRITNAAGSLMTAPTGPIHPMMQQQGGFPRGGVPVLPVPKKKRR